MTDYKMNWPLADDILIELGRLSCLWNALELALNFSITKLSGFDVGAPVPFILTVHSSFPQRLDIFGTLCELQLPNYPNLKNYKDVITKIKQVQSLRNKLVHNAISLDPITKKHKLALASARQSLKAKVEDIDAKEIHEACKEIHKIHIELHNLISSSNTKPIWELK